MRLPIRAEGVRHQPLLPHRNGKAYREESRLSLRRTDEQEDADILELVDRLRRRPEIEAVSLSQNSYPYNGSNSTDQVRYDTLVADNWTIRRMVTPDFVRVFRYQGARGETPEQLAEMLERGSSLLPTIFTGSTTVR